MEAARSYHNMSWRHGSEELDLNFHRRVNLKSRLVKILNFENFYFQILKCLLFLNIAHLVIR
jgi:hypothetical protein